jgi:methyl-accepting chemotaxis protein
MPPSGKNQRKNYFINKKFQAAFIMRFAFIVLFFTIIFSGFLFFTSFGSTTVVFKDLRIQSIPTHEYILPSLTAGFILSMAITAILFLGLGLMYSHRIAGPMFRFGMVFKHLAEGDLSQIVRLRHHDEWQETAASLNRAFKALRSRMHKLENAVGALEKETDRLDPELKTRLAEIRKHLDQFKY